MNTRSLRFFKASFALLLVAAFFMGSLPQASAAPAAPGLHTFTQPDGSTFQGLMHGDEFFNWYETADHHPITWDDATSRWMYALPAAEGVGPSSGIAVGAGPAPGQPWKPLMPAAELEAARTRTYEASVPPVKRGRTRGQGALAVNSNTAMLLTTFSHPTTGAAIPTNYTPAEFETAFFDTSDPDALTFANLFKQMSYGLHTPTSGPAGVQAWAKAPKTHDYYGGGPTVAGTQRENGTRVRELVNWRVQNADAAFDFGPYDTDNDTFVDLVCIVHQGTGQANSGIVNDIWPIRWTLATPYTTGDTNAENEVVKVRDFIIISERNLPEPANATPMTTIGLMAHEYGHGIGWPDLYDNTNPMSAGVGNWCLMGRGCYNTTPGNPSAVPPLPAGRQGERPCWANARLRAQCNWTTPQVPVNNIQNYTIHEAKTQNQVVRLTKDGATQPEHFLLEYRRQTGFDLGLPGSGLLIWHVDTAVSTSNNNEWWNISPTDRNINAGHYIVALEQADSRFDLEKNNGQGDTGDPFNPGSTFTDNTLPNSRNYAGLSTNVAVTNITTDGDVLRADIFVKADTTFPAVAFTNPSDGLTYTSLTLLQGTALDNVGISRVKVALRRNGGGGAGEEWYNWIFDVWEATAYNGNAHEKIATGTTSWSVNIPAASMTTGSYTAFANSVDTSNAESGWRYIGFSVIAASTDPNILYSSPAAHANLNSAALPNFTGTVANWTGDSTKRFILEKISEAPGEPGSYLDWNTNTFSAPGEFGAEHQADQFNNANTWTVSLAGRGLSRGRYAMWAKLYTTDARESPWQRRPFRIDYPPVVAVVSPGHGSSSTTLNAISGTCLEPTGTGAVGGGVRFTLTDTLGRYWTGSSWSGSSTILVAPISGLSWAYNSIPSGANLAQGLYYISASLTTNTGESAASVAGQNQTQFRIDTSPPALTVSSPVSGSTISTPVLPAFGGTASDVGGIAWLNAFIRRESDLAYWTGYSWSVDSEEAPEAEGAGEIFAAPTVAYLRTNFTPAGGPWNCTAAMPRPGIDMLVGSYKFIVMAGDAAGNFIQVDAPVTLNYHASFHWVGTYSSDWDYAGNWRDDLNLFVPRAPGEHDIAIVGLGTVDAADSRTVYSFRITDGIINFSTNAAQPTVLTALTPALWTGGTINGALQIPVGTQLSINSGVQRMLGDSAILENRGTVTQEAGAPVTSYIAARINNRFGGIWRINGGGDPFDNYFGGGIFRNEGLLEKTGAGTVSLTQWLFDMPNETRSSGGVLDFAGESLFTSGALLSGTATIRWSGHEDLQGTVTQSAAVMELTDGTLTCSANATLIGTWEWEGGTIDNTIRVLSGSTLKILSAAGHTLGANAVLVNEGTVQWIGPGPIIGYSASTITNAAGARFEALNGGDIFDEYFGGSSFQNDGLFVKTSSSAATVINNWEFRNPGELKTEFGPLDVSTPLVLPHGAKLSGTGLQKWLGSTVTLTGTTTLTCPLELDGASLFVSGPGSLTNDWTWKSGPIEGQLNIPSGKRFTVTGAADHTLTASSVVNNSGTVRWDGPGPIVGFSAVTLNNRPGSVLELNAGGNVFTKYFGGDKVRMDAGAQLVKTGAAAAHIDWLVDNDGTATVSQGTLSLDEGGRGAGAFTSSSGATLVFAEGSFFLKTGATVLGAGTNQVTEAIVLAEGSVSGHFNLQGTGTLGGDGFAAGHLTLTGANQWTGGNLNGRTTLAAGGTLTISTAAAKTMNAGALLTNQGTVEFQTGATVVGYSAVTLENTTAGLVRLAGDIVPFSNYFGGNVFRNRGTLQKTAGTGAARLSDWTFDHFGTCGAATGVLELATDATFHPGARLNGPGRTRMVSGNLTVQGTTTIDTGIFQHAAGVVQGHADGTGRILAAAGASVEWTGGNLENTLTIAGVSAITGADGKYLGASAVLKNGGVMTVSGGPLHGYSASRLHNLAGATLRLTPGMTFTEYFGGDSIVNDGTLELTGTGTVTSPWAFTQSATGTLRVPIAAAGPGLTSGVLQSSASTMAGSFIAVVPAGLTPPANAEFFPLTYSSYSGAFTSVLASSGGTWQATYEANRVKIKVTGGISFESWAAAAGLAGANALPNADPDKDGQSNFGEFAFNTSPTAGGGAPQTGSMESISGQPWLTLHYRRWTEREAAGVTYTPEGSASLDDWNGAGIVDEVDPAAPVIPGSTARRCRVPMDGALKFLRVMPTKP